MAQPKRCVALAAGATAAALFAAPAFTTAPVVAESTASTSLRGQSRASTQSASTGVTGTTVAAAGVLALGAAASRGRQQKVARAGVLTKDDQGRFRFDAPETPIVPEEQPGVTKPLGFFDPLGFSKSGLMTFPGDSTGFKHLRTAEIKHGRFGAAVAPQTATIGTTSTRSCLVKTDGACVISFDRFISTRVCSSALGAVGSACPEFGCAPPDGGWYNNKHGRFAMMAATGSLFAHFVKLPGFEDVPTGLAALNTTKGAEGFALLFFLIAGHEAVTWKPMKGEPGSFGDPFAWKQFTPEMRTKELNNGRIAMFAIIGQIVAELQTGKGPVEQFAG